MSVIWHLRGGKSVSGADEFLILEDMKRWTIGSGRFILAPPPKCTQHGGGASAQRARTRNAPGLLFIARAGERGLVERALTRLVEPLEPAAFAQLNFQSSGQWQQVMSIVDRIFEHPFRERPTAPIGFLRAFDQLDPEVALYQRSQAELAQTEKARRNHRVENALRDEVQTAPEQPQIEISAVQNDLFFGEGGAERRKIDIGEWIDNDVAVRQTDLKQAKLFTIGMETVGFGVDRDTVSRIDA